MTIHDCEAVPADHKSECGTLSIDIMGAMARKVWKGIDAFLRLFDSVTYTHVSCSDTGSKSSDAGTDTHTNDTGIRTSANDKSGNGATANVASYLSQTVLCFVTMMFL